MIRLRNVTLAALAALLVAGCAEMADLPPAPADMRRQEWPRFLPQAQVLASRPTDIAATRARIGGLQTRLARLRARARLLRAPVIDAQERLRMMNGARGG